MWSKNQIRKDTQQSTDIICFPQAKQTVLAGSLFQGAGYRWISAGSCNFNCICRDHRSVHHWLVFFAPYQISCFQNRSGMWIDMHDERFVRYSYLSDILAWISLSDSVILHQVELSVQTVWWLSLFEALWFCWWDLNVPLDSKEGSNRYMYLMYVPNVLYITQWDCQDDNSCFSNTYLPLLVQTL